MSLSEHQLALTRDLAIRKPGDRFRVWLSLTCPPYAIIKPLGDEGLSFWEAVAAALESSSDGQMETLQMETMVAIIDGHGRFLLCGPAVSADYLKVLSRLVSRWSAYHPMLAALIHAGVITRPIPELDDDIRQVSPRQPPPVFNARAWALLVTPSPTTVETALQVSRTGDALWYWLAPDAPQPLLLQPLRSDPFGMMIGELSERAEQATQDVDWISRRGRCVIGEDGLLDFFGDPLDPDGYWLLAEWVRDHVDQHPALAKLHSARFSGEVPDPLAWDGILPSAMPGSAQEVAENLHEPECWFWLAEGYLTTMPTASDPDGSQFRARIQSLSRRYPGREPLIGMVTRLESGGFLFTVQDGRAPRWQIDLSRFLSIHMPAIPALSALTRSRFTCVTEQGITAAECFSMRI